LLSLQSFDSQSFDGLLNLLGERREVISLQPERGAERDAGPAGRRHPCLLVQDFIEPFEADRDHWHA
jgi:hypothetical protein